jgi:hypothetical protein
MTLQQQPPKTTAYLCVQVLEDRPSTMPKVTEPTDQHPVEFFCNRLDRTAPLARSQFLDPRLHLRQALATGIDLVPAKRVAQKREAFDAAVNNLRFRRMQSQTGLLHPLGDHLQSHFGRELAATENDKVVRVPHHLEALFGHLVIQRIEIQIRQHG